MRSVDDVSRFDLFVGEGNERVDYRVMFRAAFDTVVNTVRHMPARFRTFLPRSIQRRVRLRARHEQVFYAQWLAGLKQRIQGACQRGLLAANGEQMRLYHDIGREILDRQSRQGWGAKVIDRLSADLRAGFPDMSWSHRLGTRKRSRKRSLDTGPAKNSQSTGPTPSDNCANAPSEKIFPFACENQIARATSIRSHTVSK
jgi:DUF1016 N-terminal domain